MSLDELWDELAARKVKLRFCESGELLYHSPVGELPPKILSSLLAWSWEIRFLGTLEEVCPEGPAVWRRTAAVVDVILAGQLSGEGAVKQLDRALSLDAQSRGELN